MSAQHIFQCECPCVLERLKMLNKNSGCWEELSGCKEEKKSVEHHSWLSSRGAAEEMKIAEAWSRFSALLPPISTWESHLGTLKIIFQILKSENGCGRVLEAWSHFSALLPSISTWEPKSYSFRFLDLKMAAEELWSPELFFCASQTYFH